MTSDRKHLSIEQGILLAKKALKKGKEAEALNIYRAILESQPSHPVAKKAVRKLNKNNACHRLNNGGTQPMGQLNPPIERIKALETLYQVGDSSQTEQACRKLLEAYPHSLIVLSVLGVALMEQEKFGEAAHEFYQVILHHPENADAYYNRGIALRGLGRLSEATQSYDEAIRLRPNYVDAWFNRGNALKEQGDKKKAISSFDRVLELEPLHVDACFNRANTLKDFEQLEEAVKGYNAVIRLKPDFSQAYTNRGLALKELGRREEAIDSLTSALAIDPNNVGAEYLLSALQGETVDRAPEEFVESVFDAYSDRFDSHLVSSLGYKAPEVLREQIEALGLAQEKFCSAIDLGCGTGLSGAVFKDLVQSMIGIDLSAGMVSQAKEKNIYDRLQVGEVVELLSRATDFFDLFISTDVFIYIGNLLPIFQSVKRQANKKAVFVFSTEHADQGEFILQETGRYAHSKDYVTSMAVSHGFEVLHFSTFNLRKEKDRWIVGGAYVLKRISI